MFDSRIKNLQKQLEEHKSDAFLVTSSYNIAYLSGILAFSIEEREARILITKNHAYLFTDARYSEMALATAPFLTLCEINSENTFSKQLNNLVRVNKIKFLGFEEENITYKEISDLEEKNPNLDLIPTEGIVEDLRLVKENGEIEKIKKACLLSDKAFSYIVKNIKAGDSEIDVKSKLENFVRSNGGELSFSSIVAFGQNSAIPHHMSSSSKLLENDVILLDFGAKVDGYCSDMTRTIFIGSKNKELIKMYDAVRESQELAIDYLRTHTYKDFSLKEAHQLANSNLRKLGYSDIPHSLGHGVGLQVHENPVVSPYSEGALLPGTVITVEPGIYKPGICGIRIEDTILITKNGLDVLTKSPKGLTVI